MEIVARKGMVDMKKKIALLGILVTFMFTITGCASWDRFVTDVKSDASGGMQRTIKVYTANGDLIAEYNGKIDIETNSGGYVKFDYDGKRYIYYNCFVESIAEIE